jgi:hypothetical protein
MLVIHPQVIFSIFTQHLIRIFALEVLATRFDLIGAPPCDVVSLGNFVLLFP